MEIPDKEEVLARFMKDYGVGSDIAEIIFEDMLLACGLTNYNAWKDITLQLNTIVQKYVIGTTTIHDHLQIFINELEESRRVTPTSDIFSKFINNMYNE